MINFQAMNPYYNAKTNVNFQGKTDKLLEQIKGYNGKTTGLNLSYHDALKVLEKAGYNVQQAKGTHVNIRKDGNTIFQLSGRDGTQIAPAQKHKIICLLRDEKIKRA